MALFTRIFRTEQPAIGFFIDGQRHEGRSGDTVLSAVLAVADAVRVNEFSAAPRAGFCQMGACQDCWMTLESGEAIRACSTPLTEGMRLRGRT